MTTEQDALEAVQLTEEQIRFWEENGYFIVGSIFDEDDLAEGREHMARVFAQEYETNVPPNKIDWWSGDPEANMKNVDNGWWADNFIKRLVMEPKIGAIAAQLARTDSMRLFQDQLLHKPGIGPARPRSATVGWHQDWAYWQCTTPGHALTARISLDGETPENGCMQVIRGSHRWPLQSDRNFFQQDADVNDLPDFNVPAGESIEMVPLVLEPGGISFHHSRTLHASTENRTHDPRRTIVVHMLPGYTRFKAGTGDHPWNVAVLADQKAGELEEGDLWEGDRFPLLYPTIGANGR
jgi:ectoine hydroxylase-related dioxygenase (phytanoyl-CoA dioxygenase family)